MEVVGSITYFNFDFTFSIEQYYLKFRNFCFYFPLFFVDVNFKLLLYYFAHLLSVELISDNK